MKKSYIAPKVDVVEIKVKNSLLIVSESSSGTEATVTFSTTEYQAGDDID